LPVFFTGAIPEFDMIVCVFIEELS